MTRRGVLGVAALGGVTLAVPAIRPRRALAQVGEVFAQMRAQWAATMVGQGYNPDDPAFAGRLAAISEAGRTAWESMNTAPGRTYLWEDAQLSKVQSFAISRSYRRLKAMALAWATPECPLFEDSGLLKATADGLDWMAANYYTANGEEVGNWYEWEVSGPIALNDAALLLYDRLGVDRVDTYMRSVANYVPKVSRKGANRLFLVNVTTGRGVLSRDADVVAGAVDALQPVLTYVDDRAGDNPNGFYRDGSFVQHLHFPYTGGYGKDLLEMLPGILARVAGTPWEVADPVVFDWVTNSFEPLLWHGLMPDMVSGRGVSRWKTSDHTRGHPVVIATLSLLASAPDGRRADLAAMVKEWLTTDDYDDVLREASIPEVLAARELLTDDAISPRGELLGCTVFGAMDRVMHRRPGWAVGLAMCSRRIAHYETGDKENLKGWFTSDGMVWLYNDDLGQFSDDWWPTVDPYRLPGTTVSRKPRKPISLPWLEEPVNPNDWVGGASLAGRCGAVGMALDADKSSLVVRKSWFCFDDKVVALGSGITCSDGYPVHTTVENRRLHAKSPETITVDGNAVLPELGSQDSFADARWLHLEGTGGYVLDTPTTVHGVREERTGRWTDINKHPLFADHTEPVTRRYATFWVDHGTDPDDAEYGYVMLPGAGVEGTAAYAGRPDAAVLARDATVHAVRDLFPGVLGATMWTAGQVSVASADGPAAVLVREGDDILEIAVADPTQLRDTVVVEVAVPATGVVSADEGVTVDSLAPVVRLHVDVRGLTGITRSARLRYPALDVDAVRERLRALIEAGSVTQGIGRSLGAKLRAAARSARRGDTDAAVSQVFAIRHEVRAQWGKGIDGQAAADLDDLAQRLIARVS